MKQCGYNYSKQIHFLIVCCIVFSAFITMQTALAEINPNNLSLNNFYKVSHILYRSEQPLPKEMRQLEKVGIKTVINLRLIHSDRDEAENTQLNLVWIPMRAGNITDEKMIQILNAIKDSPKPILIHCWHGSDRTGVAVAMYRLVFQNWTKEDAINELMQPKYGHSSGIYKNIAEYINQVDVNAIKLKIFNPSTESKQ